MEYELKQASPQALELVKAEIDNVGINETSHKNTKYPFDALKLGYCFTIPLNEANEHSLRQCSYRAGVKFKKKFTVIKHADFDCFEVARIG